MKNQTMFDNPNRPMNLQLFADGQDIRDFDDPGLATDVAALFNTDAGTEQPMEPPVPAPTAPTGATVPPVNPNPPQTEPSPAEPPQPPVDGQLQLCLKINHTLTMIYIRYQFLLHYNFN